MIVNTTTARYISAVTTAVEDGTIPEADLTIVCPECQVTMDAFTNDNHIVAYHPEDRYIMFVIMGCEGYAVVNPALVNMVDEFPDWTPASA